MENKEILELAKWHMKMAIGLVELFRTQQQKPDLMLPVKKGDVLPKFTKVENQLVAHLGANISIKEIARLRGRSRKTIEAQLYNLQKKLKFDNRNELREFAKEPAGC